MSEEKITENSSEKSLITREFKDRIFRFTFGHEKNRHMTLSLYNAVSGKHYTNPDELEITTLNDVLYVTMKNDLSFIIDGTMNIYEHQSTYNPNIPIRMFSYAASVYDKYIQKYISTRIYSGVQQKLPIPKLICFFNGTEKKDDRVILSLRDAFDIDGTTEPDIEVKVTMININYGHNQELMEACRPLKEYSWFIDKIRTYTEEYSIIMSEGFLEKAVDRALDEMPSDWMLKDFLEENRAEVKSMWMAEYDEQKVWDGIRDAYREETARVVEKEKQRADEAEIRADEAEIRADEAENAFINSISNIMKRNNCGMEEAMEIMGIAVESRDKYRRMMGKSI